MEEIFRNMLECPVCYVLLDDPVFFPKCCHVSCRGCAKIKMGYLVDCPWCGEPSSSIDINPVPLIAQLVSEIRKLENSEVDDDDVAEEEVVVVAGVPRRRQEPRAVKKKKS